MDLGCLDLCSISTLEKHSNDVFDPDKKDDIDSKDSVLPPSTSSSSKIPKNKIPKGSGLSAHTAVNKSYSQMKKSHRKSTSPLNWFPRTKVDSYLKRKIRLLQEVEGMTSTLDETLGDSNPHYSRVLKEKMAAREAACAAMEARKAALVEASWCRILRAARIHRKEAEALLLEADKKVAEAFEAAASLGVIMYDRPDCPRNPFEIETSSINMGGSTTHTVTASFETAFDVDKEVAAAVKTAFTRLANSPTSFDKDEHKELLRRISQNPDMDEAAAEASECTSGCDSDTLSELESEPQVRTENRIMLRSKHVPDTNSTKLIDMMLGRIKCLHEEELASLATIVATCGLNAVLLEVENTKHHDAESGSGNILLSSGTASSNCSVFGGGASRRYSVGFFRKAPTRKERTVPELPSLDKVLVKHTSKLEKEVLDAKNRRKNESMGTVDGNCGSSDNCNNVPEAVPDLGSILVKHVSKLQKEMEVAKKTSGKEFGIKKKHIGKQEDNGTGDLPSLDKFLVKHVSKLEREVQEAKSRRKNGAMEISSISSENDKSAASDKDVKELHDVLNLSSANGSQAGKENVDLNKETVEVSNGTAKFREESKSPNMTPFARQQKSVSRIERAKMETMATFSCDDGNGRSQSDCTLDMIFVKPVHRLEREKKQASELGRDYGTYSNKKKSEPDGSHCEGLENVLLMHIPKLVKEKMEFNSKEEETKLKKVDVQTSSIDSLDRILVKHQSRLEKEKLALKQPVGEIKHSRTRRLAREKQLQQEWDSWSLGSSGHPQGSKLEQETASSMRTVSNVDSQSISLDQILVKHQSGLEKEKLAPRQPVEEIKQSNARREARERELQEAWGGLSLGNAIRPHVSRLERDKAAWTKAEEEEKRTGGRKGVEA